MKLVDIITYKISSTAGDREYLILKYALKSGAAYIARAAGGRILYAGKHKDKADAACENHFESTQGMAA